MNTTTLVLLPGLDGTGILLAPLVRHLPEWIRPVVIQYPHKGTNSYEEIIEFVETQVATLERFAVLGWSFGGPLALMLANRRPSHVCAVILCATFVTPPLPHLIPYRWLARAPIIGAIRAFRRIRFLIAGFAEPELRRAKAKLWNTIGARVLAARSRAVMKVDARAQLKMCHAPLMYLASTHDKVVRKTSRDEVLAIAPQTKVCEIEGPHLALFTNPQAAVECINLFLGEVPVERPKAKAGVPPVVS
jgi:pimeloyl-ACP methyl ester carboxylesterase